jgi:hypothetical protein
VIARLADWVQRRSIAILCVASVLALIGLGLMVWSVVQPTPMPVILAMSVGQGIGMLSFALFLVVVLVDLRKKKVLDE